MRDITIIGCEVLRDEICSLAHGCDVEFLPGRLHFRRRELRETLAERIAAVPDGRTVLLGFGRCAIAGGSLEAGTHRLVVPAIDNCVALLLGSEAMYRHEMKQHPGTLYYTRGWTQGMDDPYAMYLQARERLGGEAADRWARLLFANYSRVALIEADSLPMAPCRRYVDRVADCSGLPLETVSGSLGLLEKLICGPHDDDVIVVPPGNILDDRSFRHHVRRRRATLRAELEPSLC